ncbi:hypothetical protein APHAL10511_005372 [Amanita phalloides]|nr:hypothetical protein APHAL10511_005372 [Amanita phalloides]
MSSTTELSIQTADGPKVNNQYIVILKPECDKFKELRSMKGELDMNSQILHDYDANFLNGFAAKLSQNVLELLKQHDGIESIYEDSFTTIEWPVVENNITTMEDSGNEDEDPLEDENPLGVPNSSIDVRDLHATLGRASTTTQNNATWGLQRINQRQKVNGNPGAVGFKFTYDKRAGNGVDIYILDTGIRTTHQDFGRRARFGFSAITGQTEDGNGHGTQYVGSHDQYALSLPFNLPNSVAGTCIGTTFGVAKRANAISVKIIDNQGVITTSNALAGLDYTFREAAVSRRPAVVNASWGFNANRPLEIAITRLIQAGIHVVAAAGNSNINANHTMPASVQGVITIAASSIQDVRWPSSNWGPAIDLFAPGDNVISASNRGDNQRVPMSGTSFAAPHAAGVAALLLSMGGNTTPATLLDMLRNRLAVGNVLGNVPTNTRNFLLQSR